MGLEELRQAWNVDRVRSKVFATRLVTPKLLIGASDRGITRKLDKECIEIAIQLDSAPNQHSIRSWLTIGLPDAKCRGLPCPLCQCAFGKSFCTSRSKWDEMEDPRQEEACPPIKTAISKLISVCFQQ